MNGPARTTATTPPLDRETIAEFGPHLAYAADDRLDTGVEPDKYVKTHCCFCGQQCGMQLKVKGNLVVGVEPWYEFPFNKGMMCPKGIKRYLQQAHPDRLLHAYEKDAASPGGFRTMAYDAAIRKTAGEIDRIQTTYGKDAFALLSGASLTTEKTYLMGKFAHMCLRTANIDYNGRLCMVSAAAGNKKAFGIDRAANPWDDLLGADVILVSGANIAECAPITTNYVWQAREHGARVIVVDPRITPIARTCDLFLPVKPGRDTALFNGILHLMIEHDWVDRQFIANHTVGFDAVAAHVRDWTPQRTAEVTGIAVKSIQQAAEWWGTAKTSFLCHARGLEHHSHGVQNVMSAINIVLASGRIGRPNCGYATITGQGNGQGGREHGQKCDQLPGGRDLANPEHRAYVAGVWGMDPADLPQPGVDAYEIIRKIDRGEIKGLLSLCFNPVVSLPDNNFVRQALEKLEYYVVIDFFMSESARYADRRPAGLASGRGRRHRHPDGRACHQDQQGRRVPGRGPARLADRPGHRRRPGPCSGADLRDSPRDVRRAAHRLQGRDRRLLGDYLRAHRGELRRLLAVSERRAGGRPDARAARHAAAVRTGVMESGRERRRAVLFSRRQGPPERDPVRGTGRGRG